MNYFILTFLTMCFIMLNPTQAFSQNNKIMTITYQTKQSKDDKRFEYDNELLKMALEKTKEKYGDYNLVPLKITANHKRIEELALNGEIENLFYKFSASNDRLTKYGYIPFPIDLGIVGYRVAFISKTNEEKIKNINTLEELKKQSVIQGLGWLDVEILKSNGFEVMEGSNYSGLFKMIARNRGDLFLRGANELYNEWDSNKHIKNLTYDTSIIVYYPLPRFYFTNKKNKNAIERIREGLIISYNDGSLIKLWEKHYKQSIDFTNLKKRKIFKLENPFLEGMDKSYEKYIYNPFIK